MKKTEHEKKEHEKQEQVPEEVVDQEPSTEPDLKEELQKERDQYKDLYLRSQAEFQNYKRRVEREKSDLYRFANERLLENLLPVMDTIERALKSLEDTQDFQTVHEGVEKIQKCLLEFLDKEGVKAIEALGKDFDHNLHHAVLTEEAEEENKILEVLQTGYTIHDKILRPTMVKVSK